MRKFVYQILIILLAASKTCTAQGVDTLAANIGNLPNHFFSRIQKKYSSIEKSLSKKTLPLVSRPVSNLPNTTPL